MAEHDDKHGAGHEIAEPAYAAVELGVGRTRREAMRDGSELGRRTGAYDQARCGAALEESLAGTAPLLLVEDLLELTVGQAAAELAQADSMAMAELLAERDTALLELLRTRQTAARTQQVVADIAEHRGHRWLRPVTLAQVAVVILAVVIAMLLRGGGSPAPVERSC